MRELLGKKLVKLSMVIMLLTAFSLQATYAWSIFSIKNAAVFTMASVAGRFSPDDEPVIMKSSMVEEGNWPELNDNIALSDWLKLNSGLIFEKDLEAYPAEVNDLVFVKIILRNYSNIPTYFRVKLNENFKAVYAVGMHEDTGDSDPNFDLMLEYEDEWFYYTAEPLSPVENCDEYAIWICTYITEDSVEEGTSEISFNPMVELIQVEGAYADGENPWNSDENGLKWFTSGLLKFSERKGNGLEIQSSGLVGVSLSDWTLEYDYSDSGGIIIPVGFLNSEVEGTSIELPETVVPEVPNEPAEPEEVADNLEESIESEEEISEPEEETAEEPEIQE